jgi:hypothetical protein
MSSDEALEMLKNWQRNGMLLELSSKTFIPDLLMKSSNVRVRAVDASSLVLDVQDSTGGVTLDITGARFAGATPGETPSGSFAAFLEITLPNGAQGVLSEQSPVG